MRSGLAQWNPCRPKAELQTARLASRLMAGTVMLTAPARGAIEF